MNLKEYLNKKKISAYDFAQQIGYTRQLLSLYLTGSREASPRFAKLVNIETKGEVTLKEIEEYTAKAQIEKENAIKTKKRYFSLEKGVMKHCCKKCKTKLQEKGLIDSVS